MTRLFIAEPFCDADMLAALGLSPGTTAATLTAMRLVGAGPGGLPGRAADTGAALPGGLVACDADALSLLRFVAGSIGWEVLSSAPGLAVDGSPVDGEVAALLPPDREPGEPWDATAFAARWRAAWLEALPEIRSYGGRFTADEVAARLSPILSRCHSAAMAQRQMRPFHGRFGAGDVTVHNRQRPYSAFFSVEEIRLSHRRYAGGKSAILDRAVFMSADAVTVLPYDPARDRVLLVEQFRAGPFARGDRFPWILEPVAGRIEPGHTPEETARKETLEEAGLDLGALHLVAQYYPSTGCFSEYLHSFVGLADLPDGIEGLHGAADENEDIRTLVMSREEFLSRVQAGEMPDAPLILTAYWMMANADRLRGIG